MTTFRPEEFVNALASNALREVPPRVIEGLVKPANDGAQDTFLFSPGYDQTTWTEVSSKLFARIDAVEYKDEGCCGCTKTFARLTLPDADGPGAGYVDLLVAFSAVQRRRCPPGLVRKLEQLCDGDPESWACKKLEECEGETVEELAGVPALAASASWNEQGRLCAMVTAACRAGDAVACQILPIVCSHRWGSSWSEWPAGSAAQDSLALEFGDRSGKEHVIYCRALCAACRNGSAHACEMLARDCRGFPCGR